MKYLSVFSGIGGFERGIEEAWNEYHGSKSNKTMPGSSINKINKVGQFTNHQGDRVYGVDGIAPTLKANGGGQNGKSVLIQRYDNYNHTVADKEVAGTLKKSGADPNLLIVNQTSVVDEASNVPSLPERGVEYPLIEIADGEKLECIGYSEINKWPISIYQYHWPEHKSLGDITKIDPKDLEDFDLLVGGFPCFAAGTLILTKSGLKKIEDITIGEEVLTHKNRWRKVLNTFITKDKPTRIIKAHGMRDTETTDEHPYWSIKLNNVRNPTWVKARKLKKDVHYIGRPIKIEQNYLESCPALFGKSLDVYTEHYAWGKVVDNQLTGEKKTVYNIEVEEDNSYMANGAMVHNCQSFSMAGKRLGFEDARGTLFFEIARILKVKRPKLCVLENVKGLVSHDGGKTLETILFILQELGYYINWEIYNSKDYGVPQNRERIFIKCYHVRDLLKNKKSFVIKQWLFQLLLDNIDEVEALQNLSTIKSKDELLGYMVYREIVLQFGEHIKSIQKLCDKNHFNYKTLTLQDVYNSFQPNLFGGNDTNNVWNAINVLSDDIIKSGKSIKELSKLLDKYTKYDLLSVMIYSLIEYRSKKATEYNEALENDLIIIESSKGEGKYERINYKDEEIIATEDGSMYKLQDKSIFKESFIINCIGEGSKTKIFPIGENGVLFNEKGTTECGRTQAQYSGSLPKSGVMKADSTFIKVNGKDINIDEYNEQVYGSRKINKNGEVCSTVLGRDYKDPKLVQVSVPDKDIIIAGKIEEGRFEQVKTVYGTDGIAPAVGRADAKTIKIEVNGIQPKIEVKCVAQRGRGEGWKQKLEERGDGLTNTLTGVQKDNMILVTETDVKALAARRSENGRKLRKENMKHGKDYTPFAEKELVEREDDVIGCLTKSATNKDNLLSVRVADYRNDEGLRVRGEEISPCLSQRRSSETDISTMAPLVVISNESKNEIQGKFGKTVYNPNGISPTVRDNHGDVIRIKDNRIGGGVLPNSKGKVHQQDYVHSNVGENNGTVDPNSGVKFIPIIRRLTPIECERLQGFEDDWTLYGRVCNKKTNKLETQIITDSHRYETCGNAVTVNVIKALFLEIFSEIF